MLDGRYDDIKRGRVASVDAEDAFARLRQVQFGDIVKIGSENQHASKTPEEAIVGRSGREVDGDRRAASCDAARGRAGRAGRFFCAR